MKRLRPRVQFKSDLPSMTQQHLKDECDINSILEKYRKTGMISHVNRNQGSHADFSQFRDFQTNLNFVKEALHSFEQLPAHVRNRFANDPQQLVDFVHDPTNYEEAQKLGLVPQKAASENTDSKNDDLTTKTPESNQAATSNV